MIDCYRGMLVSLVKPSDRPWLLAVHRIAGDCASRQAIRYAKGGRHTINNKHPHCEPQAAAGALRGVVQLCPAAVNHSLSNERKAGLQSPTYNRNCVATQCSTALPGSTASHTLVCPNKDGHLCSYKRLATCISLHNQPLVRETSVGGCKCTSRDTAYQTKPSYTTHQQLAHTTTQTIQLMSGWACLLLPWLPP
jgi:hypothetical protein